MYHDGIRCFALCVAVAVVVTHWLHGGRMTVTSSTERTPSKHNVNECNT